MFWECWKTRNKVLFENLWGCPMRVKTSIIGEFNDWYKPIKMKKSRVIHQPSFPLGWPINYFDGVA